MKPHRFKTLTSRGEVRITLEWPTNAAAWYYRFKIKGQREYKSTHTSIQSVAKATAIRAAEAATMLHGSTGKGYTYRQAVDESLKARWPDLTGDTWRDSNQRLKQYLEHVGEARLVADTDMDGAIELVQGYLRARREQKLSPQTIRNDQLVLSAFYAWLMREKRSKVPWRGNPASREWLSLPVVVRKAKPPIAASVQRELIEWAIETDLWPCVVLALGVGLRPVEISRMKWEHIDLEQRIIRAFAKNTQRWIPIPERVVDELRAWRQLPPRITPRPIWNDHLDTMHDKLNDLRENGLPDTVTWQALRRTAAFRISREVDIMTYARTLGHSLQVAQDHYLDFDSMGPHAASMILKPNDWPKVGKKVGIIL